MMLHRDDFLPTRYSEVCNRYNHTEHGRSEVIPYPHNGRCNQSNGASKTTYSNGFIAMF